MSHKGNDYWNQDVFEMEKGLNIVKNTLWNNNIKGAWIIVGSDGRVFKDGFELKSEAKNYLKNGFKRIIEKI